MNRELLAMRTVTEEDEEISRMSVAKLPSVEDKTE